MRIKWRQSNILESVNSFSWGDRSKCRIREILIAAMKRRIFSGLQHTCHDRHNAWDMFHTKGISRNLPYRIKITKIMTEKQTTNEEWNSIWNHAKCIISKWKKKVVWCVILHLPRTNCAEVFIIYYSFQEVLLNSISLSSLLQKNDTNRSMQKKIFFHTHSSTSYV